LYPNPVYQFNVDGLNCELSRDSNGISFLCTDAWIQIIEVSDDHKDQSRVEKLQKYLKQKSVCVHVGNKKQRFCIFQDYSVSYPPTNTEQYRSSMKSNKTHYVDFSQAKEDLEKIIADHF
jgi:hypothetical protein